ncbi:MULTISPECIES: HAD family hydrolase [Stenotrophomonas]|uniref:HAD family hydrolase n=1 Tax=Stenotrophomonas TaxID=40323 RepID=UPI00077050F3|nr:MULTISPECIES: HAD family hydrolase [Stenotrophomonas]AMJ58639.1 HAD family hydrolase [Stenotrophomonas sp. KCTC 12332]
MDGTLTEPVHDFELIRRELQIPPGADILQHLAALPPQQAADNHAWLMQHELVLAEAAVAAPGAQALIRALHADGCRLGILTRNARELAEVTLAAIGLAECFAAGEIIGRDEAEPKPSPAGLQYFAARWDVAPAAMRMVGDHYYDLATAKAAGVPAVLVNLPEDPWPGMAQWQLRDCAQLLQHWQAAVSL